MTRNYTTNHRARMEQKRLYCSLAIMLIGVFAFGIAFQPAAGQRKGYGKTIEAPAGYDLFKTVEGSTRFAFSGEFTIPGDFFDKGSSRFAGSISFKGVPIGSYKDQKTGDADTIVQRGKAATFDEANARATVPIEVVALSLESARPISVRVGKEWQQWNVKLGLSSTRKSEGTMTIMRRAENGGTFNSELVVYALFTFTRPSDGAEKSIDVGAMKLEGKSVEQITLRATGAPWSVATAGFQAGTNIAGLAINVRHNAPRHSHHIVHVPIFLNQ